MLKFSLVLFLAFSAASVTFAQDVDTQTYSNPACYVCAAGQTKVVDFTTATVGNIGNSKVFTSNDGSTTVTAYGYTTSNVASPMWEKGSPYGLGMVTDSNNNHEIDQSHYIQIDISKIRAVMTTNSKITITVAGMANGEVFYIYSSATLGVRGSNPLTYIISGYGLTGQTTISISPTLLTGQNYISVMPASNCAGMTLNSVTYCRPPSFVVGDPQFIGLRGQSYQIHGVSGEVYNIVSDSDFQYNSRFVFLDHGDCPVVDGKKQKGCFSHPGSFLGELGIKTRGGDKIHIVSGRAQQGFQTVELNGKPMEIGETILLNGDLGSISYNGTHTTSINVGKWEFTFENSDMFVNQRVQVANFKALRSHGLLGQTWKDVTYPTALKFVAGSVDDYVIRRSDIFGDEFVYNVFN